MDGFAVKPAYLLLAGGQSRRMGGGDKNLMALGNQTVLAHVISRITHGHADRQETVPPMVLNANGDPARYDVFRLPVVKDVVDGYAGPLAGVLTGLEWAITDHPDCTHVISFATDAPFLPVDLAARLIAALSSGADMVQAASHGRRHPVFAIWPVSMAQTLRHALVEDGLRKIDDFTAQFDCAIVNFDSDPDPFMNLNRPEDFEAAINRL